MDDNKLLTLANGERIRLQTHCAMLFEVGDLQYASPATVSRCGMVFVDPKDLKYRPFWTRWCSLREKKEEQKCLEQLFDKFVPPLITLILEGMIDGKQGEKLKQIIPLTNLNMVKIFFNSLRPKSSFLLHLDQSIMLHVGKSSSTV
jgi:dynein heavy chain, axonemal